MGVTGKTIFFFPSSILSSFSFRFSIFFLSLVFFFVVDFFEFRSQFFDDLWLLDLDTHIWIPIRHTEEISYDSWPSARRDHAMCVTEEGEVYLFGGKGRTEYAINYWWKFNFRTLLHRLKSESSHLFSPVELSSGGDIYSCGFGKHGQV